MAHVCPVTNFLSRTFCSCGRKEFNHCWLWLLHTRKVGMGFKIETITVWLGEFGLWGFLESSLVIPCLENDFLIWEGDSKGNFSVKALCALVENKRFAKLDWVLPRAIQKVVRPKVSLFFGKSMENKVAAKENLLKRGLFLEDEGLCSLSGAIREATSHMFLSCIVSWRLWSKRLDRENLLVLSGNFKMALVGMVFSQGKSECSSMGFGTFFPSLVGLVGEK